MQRQLITILTIGLFACGGPQKGSSNPATATGGSSAGEGSAGAGDQNAQASDDGASSAEGSTAGAAEEKAAGKTNDAGEFEVNDAKASSRPKQGKLKATNTEAAVRFFVVDKQKGDPIKGIVISLTSPDGKKYYTEETNDDGFAEVLVPIGKTYNLVYLSLGRRNGVSAKVKVADKPRLNLKLTMRYKRVDYPNAAVKEAPEPHLVLKGVEFETGSATLTAESHLQLDTVVEYMTYKKSARIEISGHTDNVGKKKANKKLSQKRADAVREYLIAQGIDGSRITAVGYGDEKPIASNKTAEGRQKNRRIEAREIE